MRISTKSRYSLRALIELASGPQDKPIQIRTIAKAQNLSVRYAARLFSLLHAAGIIKSYKGKGGGFKLGKNPSKVTVMDVIHAVDGDIALVKCLEDPKLCKKHDYCLARKVWENGGNILTDYFKTIKIKDLVEDYQISKKHSV